MIFGPAYAIVGHWFRRKRALAFGITSLGAAIGGVLFPIAARELFEEIGCVMSSLPCGCDDNNPQVPLDDAYPCLDSTR